MRFLLVACLAAFGGATTLDSEELAVSEESFDEKLEQGYQLLKDVREPGRLQFRGVVG